MCKKPYISDEGYCPRCPSAHNVDPDSWGHLGCLLLMVVPVFLAILFWIILFAAMLGR
jgi:hypothetical protein